jgi:hypothetical protein
MPLMCECKRPAVSPRNPYVCITCGGQCHGSRPVPDDDRYVEREIPRDSFGNYDPPDELLDHLDDQR